MHLFASTEAPAAPAQRDRADIPEPFKWNLTHIFAGWQDWQAGLRRARCQDRRVCGAPGHARRRVVASAGGAEAARRYRSARVQGGVLRLALVRPGSARQPDQRETAAGPDSLRQGRAGVRLVRPRAPEGSARTGAELDGGKPGARRVSVCPGRAVPPAGARARRQRGAPAVAGEPLRRHAERRLLGALDRGRAIPDHPPVGRHGGHADLRPVPRDPVDEPEPGRTARPRSSRSTGCTKATPTPTPRSTTG